MKTTFLPTLLIFFMCLSLGCSRFDDYTNSLDPTQGLELGEHHILINGEEQDINSPDTLEIIQNQ